MTDREIYLTRAAEARDAADAATLENVRQRCRRSEEAWMLMADRAQRSEQLKAAEADRKAKAGLKS
ncbi:MAG TPA: hypothetical protein VFT61_01745 [Sphingomicrobium sp.]|jgi:hypothetical protein|nr:hypothetical protein [Sphingomicrobium sp.]